MTAIILSVLALLIAGVALGVALHTRRQNGTMAQDFESVLEALDADMAAPAPVEPAESRRDFTVLTDIDKAIVARGRSSSP
jgi:hypothetical protein